MANPERYKSSVSALVRAKERAGVSLADSSKDDVFLEMLEDSAGKNANDENIYRPHYVAAKYLEQSITHQSVRKAEGVEFTNLVGVIRSLMQDQINVDRNLGTIVPPGYEASLALLATTVEETKKKGVRFPSMTTLINQTIL